jgi:glycosyltransferase involved in cell wall biosynthesis
VVAQTTYAAAELQLLVPPDRIAVVPNPVSSVAPTPLNGKPHAVYTGRLSREKDLGRLLVAWRMVAANVPGAKLTLVGAGAASTSTERELKASASADPVLRSTVTFTGWVEDVGAYLRSADVYVLPSLEEGMSNALLEACAWGRVVVASDIPANRAVLGDDFPLLFRAGDTDELVTALTRALLDDSLRTEALRRVEARTRASSENVIAKRIESLIYEAVRTPR